MGDIEVILRRLADMQSQAELRQAVHTEEHKALSAAMKRVELQVKTTNGQLIKAKENIVKNTISITNIEGKSAGIAIAISSLGILITLAMLL